MHPGHVCTSIVGLRPNQKQHNIVRTCTEEETGRICLVSEDLSPNNTEYAQGLARARSGLVARDRARENPILELWLGARARVGLERGLGCSARARARARARV